MGQLLGQCVGLVSGREWQVSIPRSSSPALFRCVPPYGFCNILCCLISVQRKTAQEDPRVYKQANISPIVTQASRVVTEIPFVHRNVAQHVPMIRRHVESHMKNLESSKTLREGFLHPAEDLKFLPFWIIAEVFYGELPPHLSDWLKRLIPLREDLFKGEWVAFLASFVAFRSCWKAIKGWRRAILSP